MDGALRHGFDAVGQLELFTNPSDAVPSEGIITVGGGRKIAADVRRDAPLLVDLVPSEPGTLTVDSGNDLTAGLKMEPTEHLKPDDQHGSGRYRTGVHNPGAFRNSLSELDLPAVGPIMHVMLSSARKAGQGVQMPWKSRVTERIRHQRVIPNTSNPSRITT